MFNTDWIGLILSIVTLVILLGGAVFAARRSGNALAANEWRQEAEAIRNRADRLHDELDDALKQNRDMQGQISTLESLPDLTLLLQELAEQRKGAERQTIESMRIVSEMFNNHETRAEQRHRVTLESFHQLNQGLISINDSLRRVNEDGRKRDGG